MFALLLYFSFFILFCPPARPPHPSPLLCLSLSPMWWRSCACGESPSHTSRSNTRLSARPPSLPNLPSPLPSPFPPPHTHTHTRACTRVVVVVLYLPRLACIQNDVPCGTLSSPYTRTHVYLYLGLPPRPPLACHWAGGRLPLLSHRPRPTPVSVLCWCCGGSPLPSSAPLCQAPARHGVPMCDARRRWRTRTHARARALWEGRGRGAFLCRLDPEEDA